MQIPKLSFILAISIHLVFANAQASDAESEIDSNSSILFESYDSERVPSPRNPVPKSLSKLETPASKRVPINDAVMASTPQVAASRAAREARAEWQDSNALVGVGAAIMSWDTTRLIKRFMRPEFNNDTPIDINQYLDHLPMRLSDEESEYIIDNARGQQSADYAVRVVEDQRMAHKVMDDHPFVSFVVGNSLWLFIVAFTCIIFYRKTRKNDRQTTLAFNEWLEIYTSTTSPIKQSGMAVAFLTQSIHIAKEQGAISSKQKKIVTATLKSQRATTTIVEWIDSVLPSVIRVLGKEEVDSAPARIVGMLLLLVWLSPEGKRETAVREFFERDARRQNYGTEPEITA